MATISETPGPDRRVHPREPIDVEARLFLIQHGMTLVATVIDLGLGGCRLYLEKDWRSASLQNTIEVIFKINGIAFRLFGVTQWVEAKRTLGVRFGQMPDRRRAELAEVIEELAFKRQAKAAADQADQSCGTESPVQTTPQNASRPFQVQPAGSRENQLRTTATRPIDNPSGLRVFSGTHRPSLAAQPPASTTGRELASPALRNSKPAVATGPAAPASQPALAAQGASTAPTPAPNKRDRRTTSRHSVDSTATIFLIDIMSRISGRILDVSTAGCRIHTDERFPVGIYRRVEVEFTLDGLPFRLAGVTQVVRERHSVGVRFLDLSPRKLEQLTELIEEIDEVHRNREAAAAANEPPAAE